MTGAPIRYVMVMKVITFRFPLARACGPFGQGGHTVGWREAWVGSAEEPVDRRLAPHSQPRRLAKAPPARARES
jgi:hypothetical protein